MATFDLTKGNGRGTLYGANASMAVVTATVDFSKNPGAANDVFKVITIPAGHVMEFATVVVEAPQGATCVGSLGDHSGVAALVAAGGLNLNAAAGTGVVSDLKPNAYYKDASYVALALGNNVANKGRVTVTAKFVRVR